MLAQQKKEKLEEEKCYMLVSLQVNKCTILTSRFVIQLTNAYVSTLQVGVFGNR